MLCGCIAPLILLIWGKSRIIDVISFITNISATFAVDHMYKQMGYVKLLGLPEVIL